MDMYVYLSGYLIFMNVLAFTLMGVDKRKAEKRQRRVSERTLWGTALLGGALGMTIGMYTFRHKTKHLQFKIGLPLILLIQIICWILLGGI